MNRAHRTSYRRSLRASWRDTRVLLREFRLPLILFLIMITGGGFTYYYLCGNSPDYCPASLPLAIYHVLGLTFLQPILDFPPAWYLVVFYFAMPVVGISILAQGVADFGVLLFNRRARGKEWEMALASTFNQHIVLVGLGHLGFRVVLGLIQLDQDVVVLELNPLADLVATTRSMGAAVLQDDASRESALLAAGIDRARSLILCTQNDSQNLQIALKARRINPSLEIVIRIFDDDFANALHDQFGFQALSATSMAAPAFASAAAGIDVTRPITVDGQAMSLASMRIKPSGFLVEQSVGHVERQYEVSVVLLRQGEHRDLHPDSRQLLSGGDHIAVLGGPNQISQVVLANNTQRK